MKSRRTLRASLLALAAASWGGMSSASAQTLQPLPDVALERLELDPSALGSLALGSGETMAAGRYRFATALHYEKLPLVLYRDGARYGAAINDRFMVHLLGAYALTSRIEVGAELPVIARQAGADLGPAGLQNPATFSAAAPQVRGRLALLRRENGSPVDLAGELGLGLPLGSSGSLAAGGFSATPRLLASRKLGLVLASVELGTRLRGATSLGQDRVGSELELGVSAVTDAVLKRLRLEMTMRNTIPFTGIPAALELLAGARYLFLPFLEGFALAGPGARQTPGTPAWRLVAGVAYTGTRAQAPVPHVSAEPAPAPAVAVVAPPPDPCAPGQSHEPSQCPLLDDDHDGVPNGVDQCPLDAGLAELKGCPAKDSDGDGVPDHLDNCPNEPGPASNQGCPLKKRQLVIITREKLELKQKVFFDVAKATIQKRSLQLLDQVASVLRMHDELARVIVEGHTDGQGKPQANRKLSKDRADAVVAYLTKQGVSATRLQTAGYGPDRPLAPNSTARGRARNRRVEFRLETEHVTTKDEVQEVHDEVKP